MLGCACNRGMLLTHFIRFIFAVGVSLLSVGGCTIQSTKSAAVGGYQGKVSSVRVLFDTTPPRLPSVATYGRGPIGAAAAIAMQPGNVVVAQSAVGEYERVFAWAFRERFPGLAAQYGLTVSDTAPAQLKVAIVDSSTSCTVQCVTRITLAAQLLDTSGQQIWYFKTEPGQSSIFARIDNELFDAAARELLGSMKKDGMIGG
jgi:hypothetical protein